MCETSNKKLLVCPKCGASDYKKAGTYATKKTIMQRYSCNNCNRVFALPKTENKPVVYCIRCNSNNVKKHGKYKGNQGYYCKDCKSWFYNGTKKNKIRAVKEGLVCSHCGSKNITCYGYSCKVPRYRCKDCNRITLDNNDFSQLTEKEKKFIKMYYLNLGVDLLEIAKTLKTKKKFLKYFITSLQEYSYFCK